MATHTIWVTSILHWTVVQSYLSKNLTVKLEFSLLLNSSLCTSTPTCLYSWSSHFFNWCSSTGKVMKWCLIQCCLCLLWQVHVFFVAKAMPAHNNNDKCHIKKKSCRTCLICYVRLISCDVINSLGCRPTYWLHRQK